MSSAVLKRDLTANIDKQTKFVVGTGLTVVGLGALAAAAVFVAPVSLAVGPIAAIVALVGLRIAGPQDAKSFRLYRK